MITWHELDTWCLSPNGLAAHMRDFKKIWANTDWTKYNAANNTTGTPEIPQICINEYAEMAYCGVPGRLVNWISRLEDEKITGCLPFWHQANNLNDLAAGANEGNGAWWLYQWYGNMSGKTQPVSSTTSYDKLYGVSTMDEAKRISTTLLGGYTGSIDVKLNNVTKTQTFQNAEYVNVTVQETAFSGFHGAANDTPVILKGVYPVAKDGSVTVTIENALFENAYNVTLTQATETDARMAGLILKGSSGDVYEAEQAELSGGATATAASSDPSYYMSGSGNRAVNMPTGAELTYTINVPVDGKYKLEFVYGNGQGTVRNDMNQHNPVNAEQSFSLDGGEAESITMESTLFQTMTGIKTKYYDLTAGAHTITVKTLSAVDNDMLFHDFVRVSYAGVYGQELPLLNKVYEAEHADFNKLLGNAASTVRTETSIDGYSGGGYVTGLNRRSVTAGGGIRFTVVVENSGLYNLSLRYQSASAGLANIYVGNSAVILDRVNATVALSAASGWTTTTASVYLQKGINVVDIDTSVDAAIDYLRVRETGDSANSTTIEAESAIPESMQGRIQTAQSSGASCGTYVASIPGAYADPAYLEFKYNAPAAGSYQMQVFHSNEDLAGGHFYNIKVTDKYAVFEANGQSDSPKFEPAKAAAKTIYFVDCGDHNPSTVSSGDTLGTHNSVTDQIYSEDSTGYHWGIVMETDGEENLGWNVDSEVRSESDKAVYTTYQRALSNASTDLEDGKSKTETFRYAHGQDRAGISPRYVSYQFELEPKAYDVTVCMGNSWKNAANPTVTLHAGSVADVQEQYTVAENNNTVKTMRIDLTNAEKNTAGRVELSVKATSTDPTIQMNYIVIAETAAAHQHALKHVNRTEPTTEAEGNIEYWECTSCGKKFADADGTDEIANVTLPKLDKPSRPSNPIIPILPILSGNTEEKFPFKDVSKADWYYDSVRSAWKNNLIDGVTATEFRPDSTLTVAQAIKLAAALHQLEHLGKVTLSNGSPWYSSYVEYAVANDIIEKAYQNYTDAQMNAPVTRGEFVHIFHGAESAYAAINTVADNSIPDVKMTDKFAAEIYEFYRAGILTGSDAKGTFHSASSIKRSEVSAILVRMFDTASRQNITLK